MLSKILVPVRGDGMAETVIGHAAALAERHKAHIVIAHCRAAEDEFMPYSSMLPAFARDTILRQAREAADQQEAELRERLHEIAARLNLSETDAPRHATTSIQMVEEFGSMADIIRHHGRLADLIVVAKPGRDRNLGTNSLKTGLFQTGRPVLMCAPEREVPPRLGQHLAVAWNGSLEASRAVAATLDLAIAANAVTILSGGRGEPHGATTDDLVAYYALRGVTATAHRFEAANPGAGLLAKTEEVGADVLVMGAYGHSHEREVLFGGNTQAVVDKAEIPVIFVH